jgi:hypothetical protein
MAAPCKSTAVVDEKFCAPHRTVFMLTKSHTQKGAEFEVTRSLDGATVMQVETAHIGYRNLRSLRLLDATSQRPVITVEEFGTGKRRHWEAFRGGDGTSGSDRLFVALRRPISPQLVGLHVFLDSDSSSNRAPDFIVHGSYSVGAMTISRGSGGGHDMDIAKMDRKINTPGDAHDLPGENTYTVWIKPDVDQALVLALTVVVDQMHDGYYCACSCNHQCGYKRNIQRH